MNKIFEHLQKTKLASNSISDLDFKKRSNLIFEIAKSIDKNREQIIYENKIDLKNISQNNPMKDRLILNNSRIDSMILSCKELIKIDDPLKKYDNEKTFVYSKEIKIRKKWGPLWVVACIYESRPNVTIDLIIMCIKSWNAIVLRWWKEAKKQIKF